VDRSSLEIETEMVDLTDVSFDELRKKPSAPLEPFLRRILRAVERPRLNLGGQGPPGRVD